VSLLKLIKAQIGISTTPANNFVLDASANNGTMKIARESGTDIMTVATDGKVAFPSNVKYGFLAVTPTDISNLITTGTLVKLGFPSITHQVGTGYNNTTHTFTAPVSGTYMFAAASVLHANGTGATKSIRLMLSTGKSYLLESLANDTLTGRVMGAMPLYLNAGDTVYAAYYHDVPAGTTLYQGWGEVLNYFTGYLIG
jgi:hypothetical protein